MSSLRVFIICVILTCSAVQVLANETCFNEESSRSGRCISIETCKSVKHKLTNQQVAKPCGFIGNVSKVCCVEDEPEVGAKAREKCKEYGCNPRRKRSLIVAGGSPALAREFPHMVALGYKLSDNETTYVCGGSLISNKFVLTAAHCLNSQNYGPLSSVRVGDLDLISEDDDANPEDIKISNMIVHPNYKPPSKYNDIALLELEKEVTFGPHVHPICLNTEENVDNTFVTATGWGSTSAWGGTSDKLMKVRLKVWPNHNCSEYFQSSRTLEHGLATTQLCAGSKRKNPRDTCNGDSGGPLQQFAAEFCMLKLVGVTSFGKPCQLTRAPGVYTKIYHYIDWIERNVWP